MAHDQKFPAVCCTTQAANTTSPYVHSLGSQPREVSEQSALPTTSPLLARNDPEATCGKSGSSLIGNYVGKHQILTWLLFRLNAMSYGSWPQGQKGRTLSPLRLGPAGMILSEQTSNTTSNTLHGVRHRFFSSFSPAGFLGRSIFTVSVSLLSDAVFSFGPPCCGWLGPLLLR